MYYRSLIILFVLACFAHSAQTSSSSYEAQVVGGKEQVEQVLQTQLYLPKVLLTSGFDVHVKVYFDLDSIFNATNITFEEGYNNVLRKEISRLLKFFKFRHKQNSEFETYPYYLSFHISTERYNKFIKQRYKNNLKSTLPADSSFVIYSKADLSPEYYKNGEEGLAEYLLSNIEYPKLAIEKSVEGTVVVEFIVETNGYISGLTIKQAVGAGCNEEALRLMQLTRWKPAMYHNKLVRYKMTYPITFSLRNNSRENSSASQTLGQ